MSGIDDRHSSSDGPQFLAAPHGFWHAAGKSLFGIIGLALITLAAVWLHPQKPEPGVGPGTISLLYLIVIVFVSLKAGFISSIVVSLIAVFCLNYFFLPLFASLGAKNPLDIVATIAFLVTAWAISGMVCRMRQLTEAQLAESRRTEHELRRLYDRLLVSEAQLKTTQRIARLGGWELDIATNKMLSWSDQLFEIFGTTRDEFGATYEAFLQHVHPLDREAVKAAQKATLAGLARINVEYRIVQPDGSVKYIHELGDVVRDAYGRPLRLAGTALDITERKRAEEALMLAQTQLNASVNNLRALAARLHSAREEERTRVAREIHDELGQALTAIKIDFTSLLRDLPEDQGLASPRSLSILKLLDQTIQSVRRIATELRPGILDDMGLVAALEWAAEDFQTRTGTKCALSVPDVDIPLEPERATALFRIFQETLTNVARHAEATQVSARLGKENGALILEVRDNGKGMSEEQLSGKSSLGILGMRERVLLLGGTLTIGSTLCNGTIVSVLIPDSSMVAE